MSASQPQGAQGSAPQPDPRLLKAEDVPRLQCLSEDNKQKYRPLVQNLWNIMQTKPQNSVEHNQARQKLQEWSGRLIAQERNFRAKMKQQQASQGQQAQTGQASSQAAQSANEQQQPTQQQPTQQQPPKQQSAQQPNPAQGLRPGQQGQQPQIDPEIIKHVASFKFFLPVNGPQEGTPEGDAKLKEMRNSYLMALNKQSKAAQHLKRLNAAIEARQKANQEISPEIMNQKAAIQKEYEAAKEFGDNFRKRQAQNKAEQERRSQQQSQPPPTPQQPQQATPQQPRQPSQPNIKEEPNIKVEGSQVNPSPQSQQFGNMQGGSAQQPSQGAQAPPPAGQQAMRQPPAPHSQQGQAPGQHPQFAQPGQPQPHQQPSRPQINPHQANAVQHQQTNSPHPQSATANPVPLSHQAAVSAAQRSYSNPDAQRTATPMQPGGQGNFHTPGSREREQLNNPKMPIPRQLNVTAPTPVGMGQARPTMSGPTNGAPGPMGQPVITKFPPFQLEGEGDRVLSKRKLDELVRQVTGGSEEALTPEVEEVSCGTCSPWIGTF